MIDGAARGVLAPGLLDVDLQLGRVDVDRVQVRFDRHPCAVVFVEDHVGAVRGPVDAATGLGQVLLVAVVQVEPFGDTFRRRVGELAVEVVDRLEAVQPVELQVSAAAARVALLIVLALEMEHFEGGLNALPTASHLTFIEDPHATPVGRVIGQEHRVLESWGQRDQVCGVHEVDVLPPVLPVLHERLELAVLLVVDTEGAARYGAPGLRHPRADSVGGGAVAASSPRVAAVLDGADLDRLRAVLLSDEALGVIEERRADALTSVRLVDDEDVVDEIAVRLERPHELADLAAVFVAIADAAFELHHSGVVGPGADGLDPEGVAVNLERPGVDPGCLFLAFGAVRGGPAVLPVVCRCPTGV